MFALRSELDAWRSTVEKAADLADSAGEEVADREVPVPRVEAGKAASGHPRWWTWTALASLALVAAGGLWLMFLRPAGQPADAKVEHGRLCVYDQENRLLWQHTFPAPLTGGPPSGPDWIPPVVADIDRDGNSEVVFATSNELSPDVAGVYCFERSGALRFRHNVNRHVSYGRIPAAGPWHPLALALGRDEQGAGEIWLSSVNGDQFESVVEKIDPSGRLLGEFWNPGAVTALFPTRLAGRPVLVAGGSNNEHNGSVLAVLDRRGPSGTAPALRAKFSCEGCPAGQPFAYVVLPGTELERLQDNQSGVQAIRVGEHGDLTAVVRHSLYFERLGKGQGMMSGMTNYIFAPDLTPLAAEHQPDFRVMHDEAFKRGIFDHPFGPPDDASLFPILRWNGDHYVEIGPAVPK